MIVPAPKKTGSLFETIDVRGYLGGGAFKETVFRDALRREDWSRFADKRVLVKGCGKIPVPPWAYMLVLASLGNTPRMVAYGEECAPVVVFRRRDVPQQEVEEILISAASIEKR